LPHLIIISSFSKENRKDITWFVWHSPCLLFCRIYKYVHENYVYWDCEILCIKVVIMLWFTFVCWDVWYKGYIYIWSIWILHVTPFCYVTLVQRCETFRSRIWLTLKERCETFRCHIWFSGVRLRGVMQAALEGQQQHCLTPRYGYQSLGV